MSIKRNFIIGDSWCYFKIYTGFKMADEILINSIYPLCTDLLNKKIIDKWFFIRYEDPDHHLRIRLYINNQSQIFTVISDFNKAIHHYIDQDLVWKIQMDTYQREIERYGYKTVELSEKIFFHDSEMICKLISTENLMQDENLRWLLALKLIDVFLNNFGYSLDEKCECLNLLQENFKNEFGFFSTKYCRQFGQHYRSNRTSIEMILNKNSEKDEEYVNLFKIILDASAQQQIIIDEMKSILTQKSIINNIINSHIHMSLNRLFRSQQRRHELILYDYLFCYYKSLNKRI